MIRIVIMGGGVAGTSAAFSARHYDPQAEIIIVTDEPFPLYSACVLPEYLSGDIKWDQVFLKKQSDYVRYGIKTILGQRVQKIDPAKKRLILNDSVLNYDKLIIATGSRAALPNIKGGHLKDVFTFKTLADANKVLRLVSNRRESAAVVGAGPIGVEVAAALRKKGLQVFLVEIMDRILPRLFDGDLATLLERPLVEKGIEVLKGTKVTEILGSDQVSGIRLEGDRIGCDLVIFCAGTKPNVELAQEAGITTGSFGGIKVDHLMMTNIEGIYSCGDCSEVDGSLSVLWADARREGAAAGSNAAGLETKLTKLLNLTMINIFGLRAASVGMVPPSGEISKFDGRCGRGRYRLVSSKGKNVAAQVIEPDESAYTIVNAVVAGEEGATFRHPLLAGLMYDRRNRV